MSPLEPWIVEVLLPSGMFTLMSGMGLTLQAEDFRRIAEAPRATILGTVLQLVIAPCVGLSIALAFELPPLLAAGLVIITACPGGMFSNVFVHMAKANTALSVTLTATATLITLFTMPWWVRGTLALTDAAGAPIDVPVLETALNLGMLTVLPIAIGMGVRARWPAAARYEARVTRIGMIALGIAFTADWMSRDAVPTEQLQQSVAPVAVLTVAILVLGIGLPLLFGLSKRDTATIAVEVVVKNTLLGLVLARGSLDFDATLPIIVFATAQIPLGLSVLGIWRWSEKRTA
jgi:BASS family bile acid:Na+ symporter